MSAQPANSDPDRRAHLRLVTGPASRPASDPDPSSWAGTHEVRTLSRVAAYLRRRARRLPEDSALRAELLETAEYYATAAEEAVVPHTAR